MINIGNSINHSRSVLIKHGGDAFPGEFLQESLTGILFQSRGNRFFRPLGYRMFCHPLLAFEKFLLKCRISYTLADLAGFDGYAHPVTLLIGSRIDQSVAGLPLYRFTGFFHRHMEKTEQGFKFLNGLEFVPLHDGLDHTCYLVPDIPFMVINDSERQRFTTFLFLGR